MSLFALRAALNQDLATQGCRRSFGVSAFDMTLSSQFEKYLLASLVV
jgi:hypothetical protein